MHISEARPIRAYFLEAFRLWATDNGYTPCIVVHTDSDSVQIPSQYVKDNQILLDISPKAVEDLRITADVVAFDAYFSGVRRHISVPLCAVDCIYAVETGCALDLSSDFFVDDMVSAKENEDERGECSALRFVD